MVKYYLIGLLLSCTTLLPAQDLYDINKILDIRITFAQPSWETMLDSMKQAGEDDRLIGSVSIDGVKFDSVGIRYKGNSSYFNVRNTGSNKLPLNIKSNEVIKGQRFTGDVKTLKLSNVFRDPSFLREVLSYEIAGNYLPSPRANFARVYVNDQYLGFYNNTSSVDNNFLVEEFGDKKGTLVKCDPSWDANPKGKCPKGEKASLLYQGKDTVCYYSNYEMKSETGWADLQELTYVLNKTPEKIESILNVDQALWMNAFNDVLVNLDSYSGRLCHNYYLYQDRFGIFQPIPWDMNLSFGGFRYASEGKALTDKEMQEISPFLHYKSPNRPLISQLLKTPLYRKVYIAHVKTILKDYFINNKYQTRGSQIQSQIDRYVREDQNKLYPYETFKQNLNLTAEAGTAKIIGLTQLMKARTTYLTNHPILQKTAPAITQVKHQINADSTITITAKVTSAENVFLLFRKGKHGPFKRMAMTDDGQHYDQASGDEVYGLKVPGTKGLNYYLIGEGEKTASVWPERAGYVCLEVK